MNNLQTPGPIEGLFFAQFHPTIGPRIEFRYPESCISDDLFDKFSNFIIPKPEVLGNVVTVNSLGIKIKGYPNKIENAKYERNALLFNLCLVFKPDARTSPYEPLVHKLSEYLHSLEMENSFLSHEESRKQLPLMLEQLYYDLNAYGRCILKLNLLHPLHVAAAEASAACARQETAPAENTTERRLSFSSCSGGGGGSSSVDRRRRDSGPGGHHLQDWRGGGGGARGGRGGASKAGGPASGESCGGRGCAMDRDIEQPEEMAVLYLKVVDACGAPVAVGEEQVPVIVKPDILEEMPTLDLTTQQILPFIDGVDHVAKIASQANVELDLAKKCVQNLAYYEIVKLLPIFQYSNIYIHTNKMENFYWSAVLQQKCIEYVIADVARDPPSFDEIFRLYSKFNRSVTVKQLCFSELLLGTSPSNPTLPSPAPARLLPPNIDMRRLINFGLMHGILRRIQKYPIFQPHASRNRKDRKGDLLTSLSMSLRRYCDGTASYDLLCSRFGLSHRELDQKISLDRDVIVLWK